MNNDFKRGTHLFIESTIQVINLLFGMLGNSKHTTEHDLCNDSVAG